MGRKERIDVPEALLGVKDEFMRLDAGQREALLDMVSWGEMTAEEVSYLYDLETLRVPSPSRLKIHTCIIHIHTLCFCTHTKFFQDVM